MRASSSAKLNHAREVRLQIGGCKAPGNNAITTKESWVEETAR